MSEPPSRRRVTDRVKEVAGKLTSEEAREKAAEVAKQGGRLVVDGAKNAAGAANRGFSKSVATVSLRDYRQSMEAAMAQVIEVLSAQEAEIAALRERLSRLDNANPSS